MADDKLMDAQLNDDELADVAGGGTGIDPDALKPFDPNDPINILIQKEQEAPSVSPIPGPDGTFIIPGTAGTTVNLD